MVDGKELPLGPPAARGTLGKFSLGSSSPDPTPHGLFDCHSFLPQIEKPGQSKQIIVLK